VSRPVDEHALDGPSSWWRTALLVLQGLGIVVVLVLCAPTSQQARARLTDGPPDDPARERTGDRVDERAGAVA
jgi:hypothetical protein